MMKRTRIIIGLVLVCVTAIPCLAANSVKWEDVPKPVREMILANGGTAAPIGKESKNGKAVYVAPVKDKKGNAMTTKLDKVLYTAKAHTTGGRDGASRTSDGRLDVKLSGYFGGK